MSPWVEKNVSSYGLSASEYKTEITCKWEHEVWKNWENKGPQNIRSADFEKVH